MPEVKRKKAKAGRRQIHKPGAMNKTEARYAQKLSLLRAEGGILDWAFEAVKLRLAKGTYYTPDFMVILADGEIEFHEVKGFWRDDARVKIKVAAQLFPFTFRAIKALPKKAGGGWSEEVWPA